MDTIITGPGPALTGAHIIEWHLAYLLYAVILYAIVVVCMWKVFKKANKPGWAALIPLYNVWVFFEIAHMSGLWSLLTLVPLIAYIILMIEGAALTGGLLAIIMVVYVVIAIEFAIVTFIAQFKLAKAFGHGAGFGFGLAFLHIIFMAILAFGSSKYVAKKN